MFVVVLVLEKVVWMVCGCEDRIGVVRIALVFGQGVVVICES